MPGVYDLFGNVARTRILGVLAGQSDPVTGYRVAKDAGLERTQTYKELRRLASIGVLSPEPTRAGRAGWVLTDSSIREFCLRRVRIQEIGALFERKRARLPETRRRVQAMPAIDLSKFRSRPDRVPNPREFSRDPRKDRLLRELRLQPSSRNMPRRARLANPR